MRSLTLSESGWSEPVFGLSADWKTESGKVESGWVGITNGTTPTRIAVNSVPSDARYLKRCCLSLGSAMVDFLTVPQGSYRAKVGVEHHDIGDAERR